MVNALKLIWVLVNLWRILWTFLESSKKDFYSKNKVFVFWVCGFIQPAQE